MKKNNPVEEFWSHNHLGKDVFETKNIFNFFQEHSKLTDKQTSFKKYLPKEKNKDILDVSCGVGYWLDKYNNFSQPNSLTGVDISDSSIEICKTRFHENDIKLIQENAENLKILEDKYDFISCHGALHHMENPKMALLQMNSLLKVDGEMYISIYYKNIFFNFYDKSALFRAALRNLFKGIPGRGRERLFFSNNALDLIRQFDGKNNPIGWAGKKGDIENLLPENLKISKVSYEFSPTVYLLPFLPNFIHRFISKLVPLMIYAKVIKAS